MKEHSGIRDVAAYAGVSIATVSHVINNTKHVSNETRQRVEHAMRELGYRQNTAPPRLPRLNNAEMIGLIVPDLAHSLFVSYFRALEPLLKEKGFELFLMSSNEDLETERKLLHILTGGVARGILISSVADSYERISADIPENFPIIFFDRVPRGVPYDSVTVNNYDAIYKGIEGLILRNHFKIGCITANNMSFSTKNQREDAYKAALSRYGLKEYFYYLDGMQTRGLYPGVKELIRQGCTAIVSLNGRITEGVINSLLKMEKKLGKDVEVLACQDSVENEIYSLISSVYIAQPVNELARISAELIEERIEKPSGITHQTVLSAYLVSKEDRKIY